MNNTGYAVKSIIEHFSLSLENVIVITVEVNSELVAMSSI